MLASFFLQSVDVVAAVFWLPSGVWFFFNPMDCSLPGFSVHGISQARMLEWVVLSSSRRSSRPRDRTHVSCIGRQIVYHWATRQVHQACTANYEALSMCRHFVGTEDRASREQKEGFPGGHSLQGKTDEKKSTIRSALEEEDILIVGAEDHRGEERERLSAKGKGWLAENREVAWGKDTPGRGTSGCKEQRPGLSPMCLRSSNGAEGGSLVCGWGEGHSEI